MKSEIMSLLEEYCILKRKASKEEYQLNVFRKIVKNIERSLKYLNLKEETMQRIIEVKKDILDLESELLDKTKELCEKRGYVRSVIDKIESNEYREIFEQKYIEGRTWEEIAEDLSYSTRNLYIINRKIIAALEKKESELSAPVL